MDAAIDPLRVILSFLFVLGLIGLSTLALRRYLRSQKLLGGEQGGRLRVIETRYLDTRRRLVLVGRDETQHLLLLSDKGEQVIETGIADVKK